MISGIAGFLDLGSKLCLGDAFVYGSSKAICRQSLKRGANIVFDRLNAKAVVDSYEC
jgi:hypothetical protein